MFLIKTAIWTLLYPLVLLGFAARIVFMIISFLFHSPVDIWILISSSLESTQVEEQ
jgi:hypothetical protein